MVHAVMRMWIMKMEVTYFCYSEDDIAKVGILMNVVLTEDFQS